MEERRGYGTVWAKVSGGNVVDKGDGPSGRGTAGVDKDDRSPGKGESWKPTILTDRRVRERRKSRKDCGTLDLRTR